jgi:hypothetical protein
MIRLDTKTMFKVREWERFQFAIDYQHQQVCCNNSIKALCFAQKMTSSVILAQENSGEDHP